MSPRNKSREIYELICLVQREPTSACLRSNNAIALRPAGAGTSFSWAMHLLSVQRRKAVYALYAFCREVDDIADGEASPSLKQILFMSWRTEMASLRPPPPRRWPVLGPPDRRARAEAPRWATARAECLHAGGLRPAGCRPSDQPAPARRAAARNLPGTHGDRTRCPRDQPGTDGLPQWWEIRHCDLWEGCGRTSNLPRSQD